MPLPFHGLAENQDLPRQWADEAEDGLEQRGLSGTVGPDDGQ